MQKHMIIQIVIPFVFFKFLIGYLVQLDIYRLFRGLKTIFNSCEKRFSLQSMLPRSEILHQSRRALEGQTLFELVKINPKDGWIHQKLFH